MGDETDNALDRLTQRVMELLLERTARKGFLVATGRGMLKLLGIALVPLLPFDRIVPNAEAQGGCDWHLCGMCGTVCCSASGCGGTSGQCPSGCPARSSWVGCCFNCPALKYIISYIDCCESGTSNCSGCSNCQTCSAGCPQNVWCGGSQLTYRCTIFSVVSCTHC